MNKHLELLDWHIIVAQLAENALSEAAKERCLNLEPLATLALVLSAQRETTGAKKVMESAGTPPLAAMAELKKAIKQIAMDAMLMPEDIQAVTLFLVSCRRMKSYLKNAEATGVDMAFYGRSMADLNEVEDELSRCIRNNRVDDGASERLYSLRRKISGTQDGIKARLNSLLQRNPKWFSESFVSIRSGRYTLPVKREYKQSVPGQLTDVSASGATCFIEPSSVAKMIDELNELEVEEDAEVRRILFMLTALVESRLPEIRLNMQAMETLDFLFAKAKYAQQTGANEARFSSGETISLLAAYHPLLKKETAVPLSFEVGGKNRGVVITGPNTGGKTVALKTVGLLSIMAQSGLHVPCAPESAFVIRDRVFADIGDGQSITENLSTFSSHIVGVTEILKTAMKDSLVLLDELGSGTDPQEGMGLAVAILEELCSRGCLFAATTHYPEIKAFAAEKEGLVNARMAFDRETLSPLYRLEIGAAGESCALYIAKRLGFPPRLLERAWGAAYEKRDRGALPEGEIVQIVPQAVQETIQEKPLPRSQRFSLGDCVMVYPQKEIGIVCTRADEKGVIGVIIKKRKQFISHKRLKLHVAATEMYPDDYDFAIVFESVQERKARHTMSKRHDPNAIIRKDANE